MIAKLRLPTDDERAPLIPILIPDLTEVRALADQLHAAGQAWQGEAFGWSAEYNPEQPQPPLDSALTYTPADFCIGESGIWFFSRQWEDGRAAPPVEFLDDRNLIQDEKPVARLLPPDEERAERIPGLHRGEVWLSDDFDAPLPDSFWSGDE